MIYFDYNSSAPLRPSVKIAMIEAMDLVGNSSSVHKFGRKIMHRIEKARINLARSIETDPENIIFTSGATESNSSILQSAISQGYKIFSSLAEHDSILAYVDDKYIVPVDSSGKLDLLALRQMIESDFKERKIVAISHANSETGLIQPIQAIENLCRNYSTALHIDASQTLGKVPFSFNKIGCTSVTFSSHKIGGPSGVGALIVHPSFPFNPLIHGGGHERNRRSGTHNVIGIVGFDAALEKMEDDNWEIVGRFRDQFESGILKERHLGAEVVSKSSERIPNTSYILMPSVQSDLQVINFDLEDIAVSSGSACSSGKLNPSKLLLAMGYSVEQSLSCVRFCLNPQTTSEEICEVIDVWKRIAERYKR